MTRAPRPLTALLAAVAAVGCAAPRVATTGINSVLPTRPQAPAFLNMPREEHGTVPTLLSRTAAFADTRTLTPAPALIPYEVNAPFWSDGAAKTRWISVPNEGGEGERVRFAPTGEWAFPAGTVFVKHFELAADETRPDLRRRLETRLLVRDEAGGVYGVSYRWRDDQADAELVTESRREEVTVATASGPRTQTWYYPGPADCRKCHTAAAGGVLGVNTRQLNRDRGTDNQLRTWNRLGLFKPVVDESEIPTFARLAPLDARGRSAEDRARSFLDVNCAYCHRPGGVVADFDGRYDTPLDRQLLIDVPARINLGLDRARFVAPHDVWRSVVLARINTLDGSKMPPLGHETVDREAVAVLEEWIKSLPGPPVVAPPEIVPRGGDFRRAVRVTLRHDDPEAVVRYTLDGSAPGASSPAYAEPLEITGPTTVRARAFRPGHTRSITVQETFIVE